MTCNKNTESVTCSLSKNVMNWAMQLKRLSTIKGAVLEAQQHEWDLCAHAVLLEVDEPDTAWATLQEVALQANMALLEVSVSDVVAAADGWMQTIARDDPTLVYLTPGAWMGGDGIADFLTGADPGVVDDDACRQFRETLITFLSDTVGAHPVVLVTGVGALEMMHVSLRSVGRFDRRIKIGRATDDQLVDEFMNVVGEEHMGASLLSNRPRLASLLRYEYPDRRRRALAQKALRRLAWAEGKKVEFADLLHCAAYGTSEFDREAVSAEALWRHAVHEAGHALLEHLDSVEKMPPSYCSIRTGVLSHGVVVPNVESVEVKSNDMRWLDMMRRLRTGLGGRAAEQVLLGLENLSAMGSRTDLENATKLAGKMVAAWGLPLSAGSLDEAAENLVVLVDEPSPSESAHVDRQTRRLLRAQYGQTLQILERHKDYLVRIAQTLVERTVLLQEDFEVLWQEVNSAAPKEVVGESAQPGNGIEMPEKTSWTDVSLEDQYLEEVQDALSAKGEAGFGHGEASGVDRSEQAVMSALNHPFLGRDRLQRASRVLIYIKASRGTPLVEIKRVASRVREHVRADAHVALMPFYTSERDQKICVSLLCVGIQSIAQ